MKIYKIWAESNHKATYIFGHYLKKELAEKMLNKLIENGYIGNSASDPDFGIKEIFVIEELKDERV